MIVFDYIMQNYRTQLVLWFHPKSQLTYKRSLHFKIHYRFDNSIHETIREKRKRNAGEKRLNTCVANAHSAPCNCLKSIMGVLLCCLQSIMATMP